MDVNELLKGIWEAPAVVIMRNILGIATLTWLSVQALPDGFKVFNKIEKGNLSVIAGPSITLLLYLTGLVKVPMEMAESYLAQGGITAAIVRLVTVIALGLVATGLAKWFHDWKVGPAPKKASEET